MQRLLLLSMIVIGSKWGGIPAHAQSADEAKALALIEKLGRKVQRDEKHPDKPVVALLLSKTPLTDQDLKELTAFRSLTQLDLGWTKVTDEGLKELSAFPNLSMLNLYDTQITDAGMKDLAQLKNLTSLNLIKTQVTDVGLKELAPLNKKLHTLGLHSNQLTDRVLAVLRETGLLHAFYRCKTSSGKRPSKVEEVEILDLHGTAITYAGLKHLTVLKNLSKLELSSTKITDAGLKDLAAFKKLTELYVIDTKLTPAGLKKLQLALPQCRIAR